MRQHRFTVEDLWALPRVGPPIPSPGGESLLVPVTTWSMETNRETARIWMVPSEARRAGGGGRGDGARPLTAAGVSSEQPAWSPDGRRMAFVRRPAGEAPPDRKFPGPDHEPQLHVLDLEGGEPERRTSLPMGVTDPIWFPDGRRIAFLSPLLAEAPDPESTGRLIEERARDPLEVHVTEDRVYRFWDRWLAGEGFHHLFVLDLETDALTDLTPGSRRWFDLMDPNGQYRISPDGREIAFSACRTDPPHDPVLWGVFTVRVPARPGGRAPAVREISRRAPADAVRPVYSPDGRWLVYGFQRERDFYADRVRLVARERRGGRETVLTEGWDRSADAWEVTEDGRLLILAEDEARTAWFALDLEEAIEDERARNPRRIARGGTLGAPHPAGERIYGVLHSLESPPEVVSCPSRGGRLSRHTAFTAADMREVSLGATREVWFEGAGGRSVQMFLVYPPGVKPPDRGRRPARPMPLVHVIHGGPHGISGDGWHWRWNAQAFAAPGYLVAMVNFHGSTSWGQDFAACISGRWGDQPYADLMAATDHLVEAGLADPARMAATGGSYGGYLASWIACRTDRFACIVNHAGVCDFQTQLASDITQGEVRAIGGSLWDDIEGFDRYNPIRKAGGFRSPMLVLHGEKDYRIPYDQALEIYNVYKARNLPARLVIYPEENHWILKPRSSRHWYGEVLGWLDRWLGAGGSRRRKGGARG